MFRLLYRLLSAAWFRRLLLLVLGAGRKMLRLILPEAVSSWERLGDIETSSHPSTFWRVLRIVRGVAREASEDDLALLASSLSFYIMLSLAPLLLVLLGVAEFISPLARHELMVEVNTLFGVQAGNLMRALAEGADLAAETDRVAVVLGAMVFFFSIAGVFAELQAALNRIWHIKAQPALSLISWLRKRLSSFILFGLMAFIVALAALSDPILRRVIEQPVLAAALNQLAIFAAMTLIFGLIFQYLPDANIPWRQVWGGATVTSLLFMVGRYVISLYLLRAGVATPYGAAGAFVILLLACFYFAIIVFIGAEVTQVQARTSRTPVRVEEHATVDSAAQAVSTQPSKVHRPSKPQVGAGRAPA